MNVLKPEKKLAILSALVEGCSVRATARMAGVEKKTVLRLLASVGPRCQQALNEKVRGLRCQAIECDEIWAFIGMKEGQVTKTRRQANPDLGDVYTFIALDPDTKLVATFQVGKREASTTYQFIEDLSRRIEGSVQLSTDGWKAYITAIQQSFGHRATHAEVVKLYAAEPSGFGRYSPPKVTGIEITERWGIPDRSKICTSYVERNNLTIRMQLRRFTRLTNAFSRKLDNLKAAVALWFWYYNFCRIHKTLRTTPAMAAGLTDRVWELKELAA
jgi:IS1 family transposase